ncbi:MAG TPA: hypothetical protein PKK36_10975 [Kiritimatiellia bacterium]|nr:hypothetical protein [Kiritimatiellia bacterium]
MTDTISKERRSWNMSRIRSKDTRPEIVVRCNYFIPFSQALELYERSSFRLFRTQCSSDIQTSGRNRKICGSDLRDRLGAQR